MTTMQESILDILFNAEGTHKVQKQECYQFCWPILAYHTVDIQTDMQRERQYINML